MSCVQRSIDRARLSGAKRVRLSAVLCVRVGVAAASSPAKIGPGRNFADDGIPHVVVARTALEMCGGACFELGGELVDDRVVALGGQRRRWKVATDLSGEVTHIRALPRVEPRA